MRLQVRVRERVHDDRALRGRAHEPGAFESPLEPVPSLALGAFEVSPLELVAPDPGSSAHLAHRLWRLSREALRWRCMPGEALRERAGPDAEVTSG